MNNPKQEKPKGAGKSSFELIDPNTLLQNIPIKDGQLSLTWHVEEGLIPYSYLK
jgi:hypothetical protein